MKEIRKYFGVLFIMLMITAVLAMKFPAWADEFTKEDVARWTKEFMTVVNEGSKLFHSSSLGKNKVSCDQCHPNAANTHPETYPKFQKQIGKVITLFEMVNWCLRNPLEGIPWLRTIPEWSLSWLTSTMSGGAYRCHQESINYS